jgi:hypothetical protein
MIRFETASQLVQVLGSVLENGVLLADLLAETYSVLSEHTPDDNLLSWSLALIAVLRWIRNSGEQPSQHLDSSEQ